MTAMKFGFVIVEGFEDKTSTAEHTLRRLTEVEGEVEYRTVPGVAATVLAAKCFAELTSVDAVLVFLPAASTVEPAVLTTTLDGLTNIVLDWNMPIVTTISYPDGAQLARAAVTMVNMQIEMENKAEGRMVDTSVN